MTSTQKFAAFLAALTAVCSPISAATLNWTGANNDNWFNGGNWNPAGPPNFGDDAHIGNALVPTRSGQDRYRGHSEHR